MHRIVEFAKKNPAITFITIVVAIILSYYLYTHYYKEHFDSESMGAGSSILGSLLCIGICVVQILVFYYIVKFAAKNAIKQTPSKCVQYTMQSPMQYPNYL